MKNFLFSFVFLSLTASLCADFGLPKIDRYTIENSDGSWSHVEEMDNSNEITERYCPGLPKKKTTIYNSDGTWSKIRR